jgi:SHS2 domain-containing protein
MKKYKILEETATADIIYQAFGKTLEEAFSNAALCMFDIITDLKKVKPKKEKKIEIKSEDLEALLFDFLSECLYLFDGEGLIFSEVETKIEEFKEGYVIKAILKGEKFDRKKHPVEADVKAVSYFDMEVKKNKEWMVQVLLDL